MEEARAAIAASGLNFYQLYLGRGEYQRKQWIAAGKPDECTAR
jgi:hypothetical protein